jgi:hypothetical protein
MWKVWARSGSRILMLAALGLEPVAPVGGRSEEERGPSENSVQSRVRYAFSLSLVPL